MGKTPPSLLSSTYQPTVYRSVETSAPAKHSLQQNSQPSSFVVPYRAALAVNNYSWQCNLTALLLSAKQIAQSNLVKGYCGIPERYRFCPEARKKYLAKHTYLAIATKGTTDEQLEQSRSNENF